MDGFSKRNGLVQVGWLICTLRSGQMIRVRRLVASLKKLGIRRGCKCLSGNSMLWDYYEPLKESSPGTTVKVKLSQEADNP